MMRWLDVFRIALRMLETNLLRSILTILGIGVAISLIVILIGLGYGLQQITIGSIVQSKALLSEDISPLPDSSNVLTTKDVDVVKSVTGIKEVSPVITTSGELKIKDKLIAVAVTAGTSGYLDMEGIGLNQGRKYKDGAKEVMLSPEALDLLNLKVGDVLDNDASLSYDDPNNQNVSKNISSILVTGITEPGDSPTAYVPIDAIANGDSKLTSIKAVAIDRAAVVVTSAAITKKGYQVETLLDTLDQASAIFRWVTIGLTMFGIIALIVASIGMFNTLTIALLERTREIGIMKAIGITDTTVKRLFLAESAIIGLCGGLTGVGIGLGIDGLVSLILKNVSLHFGGAQVNLFEYPIGFLPAMVLFPIGLALVTGLYPALRASRLNPLHALRYE